MGTTGAPRNTDWCTDLTASLLPADDFDPCLLQSGPERLEGSRGGQEAFQRVCH